MQKPLAITIAVCLGLTSCQVFQKSEIWENVIRVTPGDSLRDPDPSAAYAAKLHRVLLEQGVEHLVVTYQFHYLTHQRDEAVDTRTAVVYRDDTNHSYPWWLKDERTATPVWLPNGDLSSQISFYIRRPAQVIEQKAYPAGGKSSKASLAGGHWGESRGANGKVAFGMFRPATVKQRPLFADHSQHAVTKIIEARNSAAPAQSKPQIAFHANSSAKSPAPTPAAKPAPVTKIQRPAPAKVAIAKPKPSVEAPPPVASAHAGPSWTPPAVIDPVEQAHDPAPRDEHLEKIFRTENGTGYDPTSSMDRRKMEQLKHSQPRKEISQENGSRNAVGAE